ncbi:MAG TPA: DALR domain-containing protein, partial [Acidimicrobiia bacterium]|nr:DALR domain-containing protein [Acidimicrobiia bacterium]
EEATEAYRRIQRLLERAGGVDSAPDGAVLERFREAMDDDFGTPQALAILFDTIRDANRLLDEGGEAGALVAAVAEIVAVLGLDESQAAAGLDEDALREVAAEFGMEADGSPEETVERLLRARAEARQQRDFATADAVRDRLATAGVVVEDTPDGARWVRA